MGGDVSLLPFIESRGGSFRDGGVVKPLERIMAENGANLYRLRLFVNPNTNYSATNGAIQDLNYTIALAQRLKASGATILLDFHYSDTWADPGQQAKPAAWNSLSFASLNSAVRSYTRDALLAFQGAGVMPEMVQVGNEITHGMLWTSGQVVYTGSTQTQNQSWMNFGSLLNSAIQGVRDLDAQSPGQHTEIAVHIDGGDVQGRAQYYFNQLTNIAGVTPTSYDIAGLSFYPNTTTDFTNLQGNLSWLANSFSRKVMLLEANYPWKGSATGAQWPSTPAGQRDFLIAVRDAVRNLPNNRGQGVVWWYPEAIQVPGTYIWQGGAIALFDDSGGDALPALNEFSLAAPTWNAVGGGAWSQPGNWTGGLPSGAGVWARFGTAIAAPSSVVVDSTRTVGTLSFLSDHSYTIDGSATLTLDSLSGPAGISVLRGHHAIAAPLAVSDDLEVNAAWTSRLDVTGGLDAAGRTITKRGSGTLQLQHFRAARLAVTFGRVAVSPQPVANSPEGTSVASSLSIAVGASLDLANNAMVIDYSGAGGTLESALRQHLAQGRILSSSADATRKLGYADNAMLNLASFAGQSVDATSLLIGFTYAGDANLDGVVDITDLGRLASAWQTSGSWSGGDFDYSGFVDISDLGLLASNWQQGAASSDSLEDALRPLGFPMTRVPEPSLLPLAAIPWCLRRCRKFEG